MLTVLASGCGSELTELLSAPRGVMPGTFVVRLSDPYREKIEKVKEDINAQLPGVAAELDQRFADADAIDVTPEFRLTDLFTIKIPGSSSELVNQKLFTMLVDLKGENDIPYFEQVDTAKLLSTNFAVVAAAASTTQFSQQYYLDMIRWQQALADPVVDVQRATASPVIVAVLDTGINAAHDDLKSVMWEYGGVVGYDATSKVELTRAGSNDENGHGTHVAGIIGADGSNNVGIHGVGYLPKQGTSTSVTELMNIRVLDDKGSGNSEQLSQGIRWAVEKYRAQRTQAERAGQKLILNMSLGNPFETEGYNYKTDAQGEPILVDDIFAWATAQDDVLIVVAAGNESCGIGGACKIDKRQFRKTYYYPCSYKGVLCVAASTDKDAMADFSNRKASVGIVAPGFRIISTSGKNTQGYQLYSGTSQATPVVAGAAAMVWSLFPGLKASEVAAVLQRASARVPGVESEINTIVGGRLDLANAVRFAKDATAAGKSPNAIDPSLRETLPIEKVAPVELTSGEAEALPVASGESSKKRAKKRSIGCATISASVGPFGAWLPLLPLLVFVVWRRKY
jgi:subtilisin family serine protease